MRNICNKYVDCFFCHCLLIIPVERQVDTKKRKTNSLLVETTMRYQFIPKQHRPIKDAPSLANTLPGSGRAQCSLHDFSLPA